MNPSASITRLTLVLGGVRSGKSAFTEVLVKSLDVANPNFPVTYLATGLATDAEMEQRILIHRRRRPSHWVTQEESLDLAAGLRASFNLPARPWAVIIDSIDVWVANMLMEHEEEDKERLESKTLEALDEVLNVTRRSATVFMVSTEVGLSLVPPEPLGRRFQDLLGLVNQRIAAVAGTVYLVVAGVPLTIKDAPNFD